MKILKNPNLEIDFRQFVNEIEVNNTLSSKISQVAKIRDANLQGELCKNGR